MMLTQEQIEAVSKIQKGLVLINRMWDELQAVSEQHGLCMNFAALHQLGLVLRQCNDRFVIASSERAERDVREFVGWTTQALGSATDPANAFLFVPKAGSQH